MRVQTLLVLRTIIVFDAILLLLTGGLLAWFMEHPAGVIAAAACWLGSWSTRPESSPPLSSLTVPFGPWTKG